MHNANSPAADASSGVLTAALEVVSEALARLRFGAINLVVHDGKVVQIEVTEKKRLND
ncbi:MAG: YezD family protein [Porphyrobacter sp.]|jgi:hypothetical protein|nr:YezD family protein [Porphyrobacter sp.]